MNIQCTYILIMLLWDFHFLASDSDAASYMYMYMYKNYIE